MIKLCSGNVSVTKQYGVGLIVGLCLKNTLFDQIDLMYTFEFSKFNYLFMYIANNIKI